MARPRKFEETEVVERAMLVFWRHGFEGTSISDLVEATGLLRQGLYNVFGDKQGLFEAVLARYLQRVELSLTPLRSAQAGLQQLRGYVEGMLADQASRAVGACLMVKTAFGPQLTDAHIRKVIERGSRSVRSCFARVIQQAVARGELPGSTDPKAHAAYCFSVLHGLSALARTGGSRAQIDHVLSFTFSAAPMNRSS